MAQNRLSIIDLVHGDPPITNETESIGAVLNGEIYNFRALRDELLRDGHTLQTAGDTEVLVHLAEDHGAARVAQKVDGMFAFAIWDSVRECLALGRDRMGKKPLYYWYSDRLFVFASEIKGVLAHPEVPCELDEHALSAYLTFGYVPTPNTFFAGIKSLPPATVLTVSPAEEPTLEQYWRLPVPDSRGAQLDLSLDEAAAETRRLFEAAISRRLVADVPLGAFLSGGLDSSAIVAVMAGVMGQPVKTFTIGFDDHDGFDERPFARMVSSRFGTEHHESVVHPEAVELVERLVWHHDQPFGDSSAVPTFLLNEVAREHVTVSLSGDGGDELFAGYERFAAGVAVDHVHRLPAGVRDAGIQLLRRFAPSALSGRMGRLQRFGDEVHRGMPLAYLEWVGYVPERWRDRLLATADSSARDAYVNQWQEFRDVHPVNRLLALNIQTYLVDDLLVKMDRTSMAHGLEVRSPFLDTDLVEFAMRLAPHLKMRGLSLKRVLRRAVSDLLPAEILSRPKRGFGVPLDRWFRQDLAAYTSSVLGRGARVREHLAGEAVDQLMAEHRSGQADHGQALWTLLTLEVFLRRHGW